jgi:hypothetical protein
MKLWVENYTDLLTVVQSDLIGTHFYCLNNAFPVLSVTMISSRWENGPTDCNLKIDNGTNISIIAPFFIANSTPNPATSVKIGTDATRNVGSVEIKNGRWFQMTTAVDVVGAAGVTNVRVVDPAFAGVTNKIVNTGSEAVQLIEGRNVKRITGAGSPVRMTSDVGQEGAVWESYKPSDVHPFVYFNNADRKLYFGDGSLTADARLYRIAAGVLGTDDKFYAGSGLAAGNAAAATTPGSVQRKMEVFDGAGTSLGFVAVYDAIT